MKWIKIFILIATNVFCFAQSNLTYITDFRGFDDSTGNTHLIYRAGLGWFGYYHSIYHFDLSTMQDSLLIEAYYYDYPWGNLAVGIDDYEFWKNNPRFFIYGGVAINPDNHTYIWRFDGPTNYSMLPTPKNIEISKQNDSLIYIGFGGGMLISTNGGRYFSYQIIYFPLISINQNNDKILFGLDENFTLTKSIDTGKTFVIVDTSSNWNINAKMYYDYDGNHIYATSGSKLLISANNGDSWSLIRIFPDNIYLSIDNDQMGKFFLASGKVIFVATDYGSTITPYKTLDKNIIGIYKKPNSNKLYAATSSDIFEITPDSIRSIKRLWTTVDDEKTITLNSFTLYQNYPNPFNPKTKIRFTIPDGPFNPTEGDLFTTLKVFDLLGREIATLVNEPKQAGEYEVEFHASKYNLPSGVYLYELRSGSFKSAKKFVLMK
ncbi:MAG: T9SS type A sorting domain-containing protein [Ignavibacteria bacterium]